MITRLKAIRSEADYNEMVKLVDELIDAEPGSQEYDTLDIASDLVWGWEQKNVEMLPPDPIEAIKFRLEQSGLSLRDLRPLIGSDARVSEVMSGKRALTLNMVRALNRHLGIPLESLVGDRNIEQGAEDDVEKYPIHEMMRLGWMGPFSDPKAGYEKEALEHLRTTGRAETHQLALCRQNSHSYENAKTDPFALHAWCLYVRACAHEVPLNQPYRPENLTESSFVDLARLSQFEDGPLRAKAMLARIGIHLVFAKHLRRTYLDGAAMMLGDGTPVVGMTLRHDRLDNFWHCLLHELAHIKLHLGHQNGPEFYHDDFDVKGELDTVEQEADQLAAESLLPSRALAKLGNLKFASIASVHKLAEEYKVHPAIVAGRIRFETREYGKFAKLLGHGEPSAALGISW